MSDSSILNTEDYQQEADRLVIEYYTDPLCCWSWAFEPQWRRLRYEYKGKVQWHYHMGGLLPGWGNFSDPLYSVNRPQQMGPVWMEAAQLSGQPMHDRIWVDDPPASSYPACIAVKCAALQSAEAEEAYLRRLREFVMLQGKNIAKEDVLFEVAKDLAAHQPQLLNAAQFEADYQQGKGQQAFREDLQKVRFGNITRFPALVLKKQGQRSIIIVGFRPYNVLLEALQQIAPELTPVQQLSSADAYARYWGGVTEQEKAVACSV
jgi:putative protein-disulfide isomerase